MPISSAVRKTLNKVPGLRFVRQVEYHQHEEPLWKPMHLDQPEK